MKRGLLLLALLPLVALAGDHHDDAYEDGEHRIRRARPAPVRSTPEWALYDEECGSCHLAYPPGLLPRRSWTALMGGLSDHFGQNAEVDAETQRTLGAWLATWAAESGSHRRSHKFMASTLGTTPLRITDLPYWRRKHDEVPRDAFTRTSVGSRANCPACHLAADQGDFDDDSVKIPKDAPAPR